MQQRTRTPRRPRQPRHPRLAALTIAAALAVSACGDDADGTEAADATAPASTAASTPSTDTDDTGSTAGVLAVAMHDFHYGDLPDEVPAGTRIVVSNESDSELHEFVAFRLADDDERLMGDIVGDLEGLLTSGPPVAVLLAPPGGEQIAAVGDGTLSEPGRYVIVCVIPTGADPAEYLAAAAESDGPPDVAGGAPHVMNGMYAELTVTA